MGRDSAVTMSASMADFCVDLTPYPATNAFCKTATSYTGNSTFIHAGTEASLRYPARSGSASIPEAMTADSVTRCSRWIVE